MLAIQLSNEQMGARWGFECQEGICDVHENQQKNICVWRVQRRE